MQIGTKSPTVSTGFQGDRCLAYQLAAPVTERFVLESEALAAAA